MIIRIRLPCDLVCGLVKDDEISCGTSSSRHCHRVGDV